MADGAPGDPIRRLVARLTHRRAAGPRADRLAEPIDPRLPEQRLFDASEHYARIAAGDDPARRTDAASAGVRTVAPTSPSDAGAPVWVRRLAEPGGDPLETGESVSVRSNPTRTATTGRRPRRP
jgi:hypothetical protein